MKEQINNDMTAYKVLWPAPACLSRHLLSPTLPRVTLIFSTLQFLKHIKHVPGHSLPRSLHVNILPFSPNKNCTLLERLFLTTPFEQSPLAITPILFHSLCVTYNYFNSFA